MLPITVISSPSDEYLSEKQWTEEIKSNSLDIKHNGSKDGQLKNGKRVNRHRSTFDRKLSEYTTMCGQFIHEKFRTQMSFPSKTFSV